MRVVEQLAAKLEISVEDAEHALNQYIDEAREQLRSNQRVELPGIGVFQRESSGNVAFTPEPSLEALANHRFEGLSTREIPAPERSEELTDTGPLPPRTNGSEDRETPDGESAEQSHDVHAPEQSKSTEQHSEKQEPLDEDVEQFWNEASAESPLGPPPGYEDASYSVVADESETAEEDSAGESSTPEAESAPAPGSSERASSGATFSDRPRSSDSRSRQKLQIAAGILIATGAVLLLYFAWFRGSSPPPTSSAENGEQTVTAPAAASEDDTESSAAADEPPSADDDASEVEEPLPFESPLRSAEGIQPTHGGYAWVVASLEDRATAEQLRDSYAENGFRTSIFEGGQGYRVAVGQFETVEDVLATRDELPSEVSSEAWVLEIQSNMSPLASS